MPAAAPNDESSAPRIDGRRNSDGVSMLMLILLCVLSGLSMLAVTLACCGHKRKHKVSEKKMSNKNFSFKPRDQKLCSLLLACPQLTNSPP